MSSSFALTLLCIVPTLVFSQNDSISINTRIIGGRQVQSPNEFPYLAVILENNGNAQTCAGTILNPTWVLTAAHCVVEKGGVASPNSRLIAAGVTNLNQVLGKPGQATPVKRIIVHPKNPKPYPDLQKDGISPGFFDIALIELQRPIQSSSTKPASLPSPNENLAQGTTVAAAGFGSIDKRFGKKPSNLFATNVQVSPLEACKNGGLDQRRHICAGAPGRDVCDGDSGGPLVVKGEGGQDKVVGIVSFGGVCGQDKSVYTKVSFYSDWIRQMMSGQGK